MARYSGLSQFLVTASSFLGGVAVGLLLAPETRKRITEHATEIADWVDAKGDTIYERGTRHYSQLRKNVQKGIRQNIPDPYGATEYIDLDESDFINA